MSVFKTTFSRALKVIPSDDCNVPSPNLLIRSINTGVDTNQLIDSNAKFYVDVASEADGSLRREYKVNVGDVVYCYGNYKAATILEVIDNQTLLLNADIMDALYQYDIYQEGAQTGLGNQGCFLAIGGDPHVSDIYITTIGGDETLLNKVETGFLPIQVKKVWESNTTVTATNITALW
jgi:hypothetical protein